MKEFKVNFKMDLDIEDVSDAIECVYAPDNFTVTELSDIVPAVKMGILKSPAEICGCERAISVEYDKGGMFSNLHKDNPNIGLNMPIDLCDFPVEFYTNVTETIEWSAIKNGDLVEVDYGTYKATGYFWALNNVITVRVTNEETDTNRRYISNDIVKSVVILKRAKS